eukprot:s5323_g1.t1
MRKASTKRAVPRISSSSCSRCGWGGSPSPAERTPAFASFPQTIDEASEEAASTSYDALPAQRVDVEEIHRAARLHLLGPRAATTFAALHPTSKTMLQAQLSQRRLWALIGHFPAGGQCEDSSLTNSERVSFGTSGSWSKQYNIKDVAHDGNCLFQAYAFGLETKYFG